MDHPSVVARTSKSTEKNNDTAASSESSLGYPSNDVKLEREPDGAVLSAFSYARPAATFGGTGGRASSPSTNCLYEQAAAKFGSLSGIAFQGTGISNGCPNGIPVTTNSFSGGGRSADAGSTPSVGSAFSSMSSSCFGCPPFHVASTVNTATQPGTALFVKLHDLAF